jgi:hypothetical protein
VRCFGAASVTLDSIDFTGYTFYNGTDGCDSITITNSKFACPAAWKSSSPYAFIANQGKGNFVVKFNEFDGENCGTFPNDLSDPITMANSLVLQFNLFRHLPERIVSGGTGTLDYRFNLVDQPAPQPGVHENFLQWGGGSVGAVTVAFNTTYQTALGGAEAFQFYFNGTGSYSNITLSNNTIIAIPNGGQPTMSYMMHGSCHSASDCSTTVAPITGQAFMQNNYFDFSGAYAPYYGGTFTLPQAPWTSSGNIDMRTGTEIIPQ